MFPWVRLMITVPHVQLPSWMLHSVLFSSMVVVMLVYRHPAGTGVGVGVGAVVVGVGVTGQVSPVAVRLTNDALQLPDRSHVFELNVMGVASGSAVQFT